MRYQKVINSSFKLILILLIPALIAGYASALEKTVLKGRVFDVEGIPVKGVEIFVYASEDTRRPADFISPKTDSEGRFNLTVLPGTYRAVARQRSGEKYGPLKPGDKHSGEPVEVELSSGKERSMDFIVADLMDAARMTKKTREDYVVIQGRVMDSSGISVTDHYAFADSRSDIDGIPEYISEWTDDSGTYKLFLPEGDYFIGYASSFPPDEGLGIQTKVNAVSEMTEVDLVITREKEGRP